MFLVYDVQLFFHVNHLLFVLQYTTLKPLGDRVLVKINAAEEKTAGGILLPSTAQSKPQGGEVVAVGQGRTIGHLKVEVDVKVIHALLKHHV